MSSVVSNKRWVKMGRKTLTSYRAEMSFSEFKASRITLCYILFRRKYNKHADFWNMFFLVLQQMKAENLILFMLYKEEYSTVL